MDRTILIVDDNPLNLKLASDLLRLEGYRVLPCGNADAALDALSRHDLPDLILMDIALPGMDGLALTRHLRAQPRFADLPIVAMTAFAMKGDAQKALDAGCSGYVTKPIDTRLLPSQVIGFLQPRHPVADGALHIMVVEDHRIDSKLIGDSARLSGHVVQSHATAECALEALEEGHPDVVLLDLNLPGMDGLAFVHRLKSNPLANDILVVAVTAYPDEFDRRELLAAGCAAYIEKPIDTRQLLGLLDAVATGVG